MNKKEQLKRDLFIVRSIAIVVGLLVAIAYFVLLSIFGAYNPWTEAMICLFIICVVEGNYAGGYLKGLAFENRGK